MFSWVIFLIFPNQILGGNIFYPCPWETMTPISIILPLCVSKSGAFNCRLPYMHSLRIVCSNKSRPSLPAEHTQWNIQYACNAKRWIRFCSGLTTLDITQESLMWSLFPLGSISIPGRVGTVRGFTLHPTILETDCELHCSGMVLLYMGRTA